MIYIDVICKIADLNLLFVDSFTLCNLFVTSYDKNLIFTTFSTVFSEMNETNSADSQCHIKISLEGEEKLRNGAVISSHCIQVKATATFAFGKV